MAVQTIIATCVRHKVSVGNHFSTDKERQIAWAEKGMKIVLNSADMTSFVNTTKSEMAYLREKITGGAENSVTNVII